ncbi:MAG: hypothetical protein JSV16_10760, partial [Candidatus Hydrogenedentota bacterium]
MPNRPRDKKIHNSWLWDGERFYSYVKHLAVGDKDPPGYPGNLSLKQVKDEDEIRKLRQEAIVFARTDPFSGYWHQERWDQIILRDDNASVQEEMETVGDSECYVVSAKPRTGLSVKVWVDPQHDHHIARYEYVEQAGCVRPSGRKLPRGDSIRCTGTVLGFKKIDSLWVPMEIEFEGINDYTSSGNYQRENVHHKRTEFLLNPDHDAMGSFLPDDVMNGAGVVLNGRIKCIWRDGELVDEEGRKVEAEPQEPMALVGKPLPVSRQFNLGLDRDEATNRKTLVCFWDMNQRPSRWCVQRLANREKLLARKDVYVVLVHGEKADDDKLNAWLEKRKISLPVWRISGDDHEHVRQTWGVRSLPWLIVADKNHIVTAEGFGLEELDEKIRAPKAKER